MVLYRMSDLTIKLFVTHIDNSPDNFMNHATRNGCVVLFSNVFLVLIGLFFLCSWPILKTLQKCNYLTINVYM